MLQDSANGAEAGESPAGSYREADLDFGPEAAILGRALELAALAGGRAVTAEDAWRTTVASASDQRTWAEVAASAARALGLHPTQRDGTPRALRSDCPVLVRTGPSQWMLAVKRRGSRFEVVQLDARGEVRSTMTPAQLEAATSGKPWLSLQPSLGLDVIAASRRPRLADRPWLRLRSFLALERRELWVVGVYAVVIGALTLATPIAVQALVNTVAFGAVLQPLVVLTFLLLGGLVFAGILRVLETYVVEVLQRRVFIRVADDFGHRIPAIRAEALDSRYGPEIVNRFFEVVNMQKSLAVLLLDGLALTLQTVIGMVLLGFYHPILLAFDMVLVALLLAVFVAGRGAVSTALRESAAKYRIAAWLQDLSRVSALFRGAAGQRSATDRTDMLCRSYLRARKAHFRILLRQVTGGIGLQVIAMVALLGVGGWLVINRQLTLGQLVAAELVIAAIGTGFVKLGKNLEKLYDLNVGVLKIGKVVDLPVERRGGEPLRDGGPASVALRDVSVARGARTLLRHADLEVEPGDRVRLRGDGGAGKSTLLEVMAGLRDVEGGSVHVDGLDLRRADLATVRDQVALVRGAEFVEGSVIENLRVGATSHIDERRARQLLRPLKLERAVDALPAGLDTALGPSGAPLSETQARRLALARALASRPRVLLLDRALDNVGLSAGAKQTLLDTVLGPEARWTAVVVTDDPDVAARCCRDVELKDERLEVIR